MNAGLMIGTMKSLQWSNFVNTWKIFVYQPGRADIRPTEICGIVIKGGPLVHCSAGLILAVLKWVSEIGKEKRYEN
jgi:hypothetical protein